MPDRLAAHPALQPDLPSAPIGYMSLQLVKGSMPDVPSRTRLLPRQHRHLRQYRLPCPALQRWHSCFGAPTAAGHKGNPPPSLADDTNQGASNRTVQALTA